MRFWKIPAQIADEVPEGAVQISGGVKTWQRKNFMAKKLLARKCGGVKTGRPKLVCVTLGNVKFQ